METQELPAWKQKYLLDMSGLDDSDLIEAAVSSALTKSARSIDDEAPHTPEMEVLQISDDGQLQTELRFSASLFRSLSSFPYPHHSSLTICRVGPRSQTEQQ